MFLAQVSFRVLHTRTIYRQQSLGLYLTGKAASCLCFGPGFVDANLQIPVFERRRSARRTGEAVFAMPRSAHIAIEEAEDIIGTVKDVSCPLLSKIGEAFAYAQLAYREGPQALGKDSRTIEGNVLV
jgi:hypothetical protein